MNKQYDLEDRAAKFAKDTRILIKQIPRSISNIEDCKQLARSSASICANYIEANEALSKKDFLMRIKISKKEARESKFWLDLLDIADSVLDLERNRLIKEADELTLILSSILTNSKEKKMNRFEV